MKKWIPFLTPVKSLDFKDTEKYIAGHSREDITIIDVRQQSEYQERPYSGSGTDTAASAFRQL